MLDHGRLYVPAWEIVIGGMAIPEETVAVGIRAEAFVLREEDREVNRNRADIVMESDEQAETSKQYIRFPVEEYEQIQEPFEQVLRFRCAAESAFLECRRKKRDAETVSDPVPEFLLVHLKDVLLLK